MRKYCRYCAFCINGDTYYCTEHQKVLSDVKHSIKCPNFALSELGDVDTGKQYKPRKYNTSTTLRDKLQQLSFDFK